MTEARASEPHAVLDAGDRRCGEVILALKRAIDALRPGEILRLVCVDPAAPADVPAWCRMTGHRLIRREDVTFDIQRKES